MEDYKFNTVNRVIKDIDEHAQDTDHLSTNEFAIEHAEQLEGLLDPYEAIEVMDLMRKQISARNRVCELLGDLASREWAK